LIEKTIGIAQNVQNQSARIKRGLQAVTIVWNKKKVQMKTAKGRP